MKATPEEHRHIDAFDHVRTQVVLQVVIKFLGGAGQSFHELLRDEYAGWLSAGDLVRPPEDFDGPDAAVHECFAVLDTAVAQFLGEHWLEAAEGCRAAAVEQVGVPAVSWVGFCDACRTTHAVAGRTSNISYPGSVPIPVLIPRARLRRRWWRR